MRLFAFEGLRYTDRAGMRASWRRPPVRPDQREARDRFHAQSPHQFVQLTRPVAADGGDPYRFAADLHARWLRRASWRARRSPRSIPT